MGCEPKKRHSKARQGKARSHVAMTPPATQSCPQCHNPKMPHHVCPTCGSYGGKEIIEVKSKK